MERYQVTGNEYISLPTIRESDGAVEGLSFLYMQVKGMLEARGHEALMKPYVCVNGQERTLCPRWRREHCWIPTMTADADSLTLRCTYLAPIGERAIALRLEIVNHGDQPVNTEFGLRGDWAKTLHEINETTELTEGREVIRSGWNHMFVWVQRCGLPLFAIAPIVGDDQAFSEIDQGAEWEQEGFAYRIRKRGVLAAGEVQTLDVFWGVGYESVAASASAKELLRAGFDAAYVRACEWLAAREKHVPQCEELLNTNLFFAFFYASGRCIDTEELCLMTSRSPRYYVSAAYWDRDSLLWAFPAILSADAEYAREILEYVFTRQARNFGVHSRFIDGTVLEPGFELDELCAPVIALQRYVQRTDDRTLLQQTYVREALQSILRRLEKRKHPQIELYETFLQPTDDLRRYPYLTYDNALVCLVFRTLADWLEQPSLLQRAEAVRAAIYEHCVRERDGKRFFAWSVDLQGNSDVYDEPPGSLQLLPFYDFCDRTDAVWLGTLDVIRSEAYELSFAGKPIAEIGCNHAPHPWVLSICNSLLCGHADSALEHLQRTRLDNGVACESVHEDSGECMTGEAFATCAGFLAYALETALQAQ